MLVRHAMDACGEDKDVVVGVVAAVNGFPKQWSVVEWRFASVVAATAKPHSVAIVQVPPSPAGPPCDGGEEEDAPVPIGGVSLPSSLSTTITARCGGDRAVGPAVVSSPSLSIGIVKEDDDDEEDERCIEDEDTAVDVGGGDENPPCAW